MAAAERDQCWLLERELAGAKSEHKVITNEIKYRQYLLSTLETRINELESQLQSLHSGEPS